MQVKWPQIGVVATNNVEPSAETLPTAPVTAALSWSQLKRGSVPQASPHTSAEWDTLMLTDTWCTASAETDGGGNASLLVNENNGPFLANRVQAEVF